MSIPRIDPAMTAKELHKSAKKFHAAGKKYWEDCHKAGISGAVIWLTMDDSSLLLFTRGEYKEILMRNVDYVGGPSIAFGATAEK